MRIQSSHLCGKCFYSPQPLYFIFETGSLITPGLYCFGMKGPNMNLNAHRQESRARTVNHCDMHTESVRAKERPRELPRC